MVGSRHNNRQDQQRVAKTSQKPQTSSKSRLLNSLILRTPMDARVVDEGASDDESVGEVETRHGCELVDVLTADPDTLSVVLTNSVVEAKRFRQQTRRHARVETEDKESSEIAESHGTSSNSESCMVRSGVVIPGEEPVIR